MLFFWCAVFSPPINKIVDSLIDGQMIIRSIIRWNGHSTHNSLTHSHKQIEMNETKANRREH